MASNAGASKVYPAGATITESLGQDLDHARTSKLILHMNHAMMVVQTPLHEQFCKFQC